MRWLSPVRALTLSTTIGRRMPPQVGGILAVLRGAGHEAAVVGGAVRDALLGLAPHDWDVATSATQEQTASLFPHHHRLGGRHGTLLVVEEGVSVEMSTYRSSPPSLAGDLALRDFTIGAMAWLPRATDGHAGSDGRAIPGGRLIDPTGGLLDLARGLIRACDRPEDRLAEDPVRALRGIRLATALGFRIEPRTWRALTAIGPSLDGVAPERLRMEFERILLSRRPVLGLDLLRQAGLLAYVAPELLEGVGCRQNQYHRYDVWSHSLLALQNMPPDLTLRLAALLHDLGKPRTVSEDEQGRHFYGHEQVGAEMARALLRRLRFERRTVERVSHLVRYHMDLHFDPRQSDRSVRRLVRRVGAEHLEDLIWLRRADRMASGTKRGDLDPGTVQLLERIRRLAASEAKLQVRDLALNGADLMELLGKPAGPWLGRLLQRLRDEVVEGSLPNSREALAARAPDLLLLADLGRCDERQFH